MPPHDNVNSSPLPQPVSLAQAWRYWFRLGWVSFGGPAAQIALMHRELVQQRRWISERRFLHALNYCMLLPGPEAQQLATYIGWLMHRSAGGVVAGVLFVLPSLLVLMALAWLYLSWGHTAWMTGLFYGIKPAVTAVVLLAAWRMGRRVLHAPVLVAVAVAAFAGVALLGLPFPLIVAAAALSGHLAARRWPAQFQPGSSFQGGGRVPHAPALIDDDTPIPPHARWRVARLWRVLAAGALLWLLPMGALTLGLGWAHAYTQMGWFFTKAALLTFGGAYAVLPYVVQGAVGHYGWLTPAQMMDGLALGESTPGPLIMVVAFVGFVGGWSQALLGPESRLLAAVLAALLVTWFTFLPSFLFILGGGPLVESSRAMPRLHGPLAAITAAVVGVILNLALYFGRHVFWPEAASGAFDARAALLAVAAGWALGRHQRGVVEVIAASAALGWLLQTLG
jgi:chromate transporter